MLAVAFHFGGSDGLMVHFVPHIPDVGEDKRHKYRHEAHYRESEFGRRAVVDCQRACRIDERRIVGGVVVSGHPEKGEHHKHRTYARPPYTLGVVLGKSRFKHSVEHHYDSDEPQYYAPPHLDVVVEILAFKPFPAVGGEVISVIGPQEHCERQEEYHKYYSVHEHATLVEVEEAVIAGNVVHKVQRSLSAGEEQHGQSEDPVAPAEDGLKAM